MQRVVEQCFRPPGSDAPIPSLTQRRSLYTRCAITPFPSISAAAVKLLSLHATSRAQLERVRAHLQEFRLTISMAEKLVYSWPTWPARLMSKSLQKWHWAWSETGS